jgi:hypothetical protein
MATGAARAGGRGAGLADGCCVVGASACPGSAVATLVVGSWSSRGRVRRAGPGAPCPAPGRGAACCGPDWTPRPCGPDCPAGAGVAGPGRAGLPGAVAGGFCPVAFWPADFGLTGLRSTRLGVAGLWTAGLTGAGGAAEDRAPRDACARSASARRRSAAPASASRPPAPLALTALPRRRSVGASRTRCAELFARSRLIPSRDGRPSPAARRRAPGSRSTSRCPG